LDRCLEDEEPAPTVLVLHELSLFVFGKRGEVCAKSVDGSCFSRIPPKRILSQAVLVQIVEKVQQTEEMMSAWEEGFDGIEYASVLVAHENKLVPVFHVLAVPSQGLPQVAEKESPTQVGLDVC